MAGFLRQATASQSRALGPFLDDTDFKTPETGLTIANTDIKLVVNGAASANKNSGGGTHRVNGIYGVTFDATDTATVGEMEVSVLVSGALIVFDKFTVVEEAVYDAQYVASAPGYVVDQPVNTTKFGGTSVTGRDIGASVLLSTGTGTGQLDFTSGVVKANAVQLLGTAWLTPGTAGTPDVNVKLWNALTTVALPLVPTTAGRTLDVSAGGEAGVDWANVGSPTTTNGLTGTTIATSQVVASVAGSVGSVTGNVGGNVVGSVASVTARVTANTDQLAGQTVTAAAGVTFPTSVASPTNITAGTITTVTNLTNAASAGDFTATMKTSLNAATPASTGAIGTGGITAASFAAGAIDAAAIATDAIGANEVSAAAVTKIQTGLATPTNITAGTITTVTNLTNAATAGDLTATMKTSVTTAATAATPALSAAGNNAVADALLDRSAAIETGLTPRQAWRLGAAADAGKLSGAATTTVTIRNAVADSKARITATVDASGNRTAITTDVT